MRPISLALGALALVVSGCGPDIQGLCESIEGCLGGNPSDVEACVAARQYEVDVADIEGCAEEQDAYFTCFYDKADCNSSDTNTSCADDDACKAAGFSQCANGKCVDKDFSLDEPTACEAERNAYEKCQ